MNSPQGFPDNSRFTPVPNLLFGPLLEEIDDLLVLKCLLRILWLHYQKKGFPRFLTRDELMADRTLARALSVGGSSVSATLENTLGKAERLGVLIHLRLEEGQGVVDVYMPNTQEGRRAAQHLEADTLDAALPVAGNLQPLQVSRPNIFSLYEENIGVIGHIMAEELKEAEKSYPQEWIEEAFREAVVHNKRSWRYIEAILKGWTTEGRDHGEPGRHSKKVDAREWIRRHGLPRP
ncbi:MAG: DnaD domain protein [Chloroflexi bacterium]|nr:DnaD domain protein [Chloroflexota bacterium]